MHITKLPEQSFKTVSISFGSIGWHTLAFYIVLCRNQCQVNLHGKLNHSRSARPLHLHATETNSECQQMTRRHAEFFSPQSGYCALSIFMHMRFKENTMPRNQIARSYNPSIVNSLHHSMIRKENATCFSCDHPLSNVYHSPEMHDE